MFLLFSIKQQTKAARLKNDLAVLTCNLNAECAHAGKPAKKLSFSGEKDIFHSNQHLKEN